MDIYWDLFHRSSKAHGKGHPPISQNSEEWPTEWRTVFYKTYPRLLSIALPEAERSADLFQTIEDRRSSREFDGRQLSLDEYSVLFRYGCGALHRGAGSVKRTYPSGGGRYPLETYLIEFRSGTALKGGVYHYDVARHALDVLEEREFSDEDIDALFRYPWVKNAPAAVIFTGVFWRTLNKYGERGYRYLMLEAGHAGQNITLISAALGLKSCPLGGSNDERAEELLDVDGVSESVVYATVIGK